VTVTLLCFVTCGIYALFWKYRTTHELRGATGDDGLNPLTDLVLTLATCGLWGIYTDFRNAQKAHALLAACGVQRESRAVLVLILDLVGLYAITPYFLQEELNAVARARALGA